MINKIQIELPTQSDYIKRGFTDDGGSKRGPYCLKDVDHIFRGCSATKSIWSYFLPWEVLQVLSSYTFKDWLKINLLGNVKCDFSSDWSAFFAVIVWWIWR